MRVTYLVRLLADDSIGAEKIGNHWCVPRFNGMLQSAESYEDNPQLLKRRKAIEDHHDIERAQT